MSLLIPILAIWFLVLAGTVLLLYHYSCIRLDQQANTGSNQGIVPGALVKGYLVRALLGEGGFARVYLAERQSDGYFVALKVFALRKAWRYERRMLAGVAHPAFPRLLGAFHHDQSCVLVQEYVPGIDLEHYLSERGALPLGEVLELGVQLAEALAYLHGLKHPIIHRDLKPANVQLMSDGRARLLDLGIAQRLKRSGPFADWGTRDYMAPEALAQQPCQASDIYALGILLWEALAGQQPYPVVGIYPALRGWELPGLSVLLQGMVALDAVARPSASTVLAALSWLRCLAEEGVAA